MLSCAVPLLARSPEITLGRRDISIIVEFVREGKINVRLNGLREGPRPDKRITDIQRSVALMNTLSPSDATRPRFVPIGSRFH